MAEVLSKLASSLGATAVLVDLRAGISEYSAPLLLDPRVKKYCVTSTSLQSVIKWDAEAAEKAGFEHFMMKEIHEQPKAIQDTLNSVIKEDKIDLSTVEITDEEIQNFDFLYIGVNVRKILMHHL